MAIEADVQHHAERWRRGATRAALLLLPLLLAVACTDPRERALFGDSDRSERDDAPTPSVATASAARRSPPPVGVVADIDGLRVLRMRGTPRELGFQHGKAFAAEIKEGFERFVLGYRCHGIKARYGQIAKRIENEIAFPPRLLEELDGMVEGMAASGVDTTVALLKRPLSRDDLLALNTIDHWGLFGCSGFTAWGSATDDGGVLVARTFDFDVDQPEQAITRLNVVLCFEPAGAIPFVSLAFPGLVGVTTGLSARGVGTFLHVGNGAFGGGDPGRTVPLLAIARELMEQCGPDRVTAEARERLATARIRNSFLFRVTTDGRDAPPTTVFEVDPLGVGEQPLPDPARGAAPFLLATNHFVARESTFPAIPDSKIRWCSLEECATTALAGGDRRIGPDEAWTGLDQVKQSRGIVTLHALVWRPATGELWLGVSDLVDGRVVPATDGERRHLWLEELLAD
jgi:hypothetical protein